MHLRSANTFLARLVAGAVAIAVIAVVVIAVSAEAGPVRVATVSPGDGVTLAGPPAEVSVMFTRAFDALESHVTVASAAGTPVNCGEAKASGQTLTVPVRITAPGLYLVVYHVLLPDGRQLSGVTEFTVSNGQSRGDAKCEIAQAPAHHGGKDPLAIFLTILAALLLLIMMSLLVWRRLPVKA